MAANQFYPSNIPNAGTSQTREHLTRSSYLFVGPDSPANRRYPLNDAQGNAAPADVGANWTPFCNISIGNLPTNGPAAVSTTYVVNAAGAGTVAGAAVPLNTATNGLVVVGLNGGNALVVTDFPRALTYVSSSASDTGTILLTGYDQYKSLQTELITLNGTTPVPGKKAFVYIQSVTPVSATLVGNLSIGTSQIFGLPMAADPGSFDASWKVIAGAQTADAGTFVFADRTNPATSITGDVRGTYSPAAAPNGSTIYFLNYAPSLGAHLKVNSTYGVQTA
jgi:hypothetical protein